MSIGVRSFTLCYQRSFLTFLVMSMSGWGIMHCICGLHSGTHIFLKMIKWVKVCEHYAIDPRYSYHCMSMYSEGSLHPASPLETLHYGTNPHAVDMPCHV